MKLDDDQMAEIAELIKGKARPKKTFGELAESWLSRLQRVKPDNERHQARHYLRPLHSLTEETLTKARVEEVLNALLAPVGPLSPSSVNAIRSTGSLIIKDAQGNGEWKGHNPFALTRRMKQPKRIYNVLTLNEFNRLALHLEPRRRRLARVMMFIGVRPGEALALQKGDVDLARKMLKVRRSHGRNQTKTGREREFPIPDAIVEDLREAMASSTSDLVFPKEDGTRQRSDTKLTNILRSAARKAGLVSGFRYICRRYGCTHKEQHEKHQADLCCPLHDTGLRRYSCLKKACGHKEYHGDTTLALRCPTHGTKLRCGPAAKRPKLWCSPIPRFIRFYDLRHSCNTAHRQAGADPTVVKVMLGHAASDVNEDKYTHFDEAYMRRELNKLGANALEVVEEAQTDAALSSEDEAPAAASAALDLAEESRAHNSRPSSGCGACDVFKMMGRATCREHEPRPRLVTEPSAQAPLVRTSLCIRADQRQALRLAVAQRTNADVSAIIREIIDAWLANREEASEEEAENCRPEDPEETRFWANFWNQVDDCAGCWVWRGAEDNGTGVCQVGQKTVPAWRLARAYDCGETSFAELAEIRPQILPTDRCPSEHCIKPLSRHAEKRRA